jgi:hypothetical protein
MSQSQEQFLYTDSVLDALECTISRERIGTYLEAGGFNRVRAMRIYLWNTRMSECFYFPLQCAEIMLRNSIHEAFSNAYSADWPIDRKFERHVGETTIAAIAKVQSRIADAGHLITTPRIVAGLSFDFWAMMLTSKFDRPVWQTRLHRIFPHLPKDVPRRALATRIIRLKEFRNRIAHHEPILHVNHSDVQKDILEIIGHKCPHTADWVAHHSRVHIILRERP